MGCEAGGHAEHLRHARALHARLAGSNGGVTSYGPPLGASTKESGKKATKTVSIARGKPDLHYPKPGIELRVIFAFS